MTLIAEIILWICVGLIFHSYVLFPISISLLARNKKQNYANEPSNSLPFVSILISAYNEDSVIEEKINSILTSNFPEEKYELIIGSDCSDDGTDDILSRLAKEYSETIKFFPFDERQGKPNIINKLIDEAKGEIVILSDANVIFDNNTITQLLIPFSDNKIGLVDSQMINMGMKASGISVQEKAYISREVQIKHNESRLWGTMMGPFGGCFAIRKKLYEPVPSNFLVDDFFLNMIVLEKGFMAINNPKAIVFEDVSNNLAIEYKRKIRIATGNFQNLKRFKSLLIPPWTGLAYSFYSHKIIRWLGPFLIILATISLGLLAPLRTVYLIGFFSVLIILTIPVIDHFLKKLSIHISLFRFITHFCAMNLALFVGFLRFEKGVKTNVWQPTKRHQ